MTERAIEAHSGFGWRGRFWARVWERRGNRSVPVRFFLERGLLVFLNFIYMSAPKGIMTFGPMDFRIFPFRFLIVALLGFTSFAAAQTAQPVTVHSARFDYVRPQSGGDPWLQATVVLNVRPFAAGSQKGGNPEFVDRVGVSLSLAFRSRYAGPGGFRFFRSHAEAVTVENGTAYFRFYLPPSVISRDEISGDPYAYLVEVTIGGKMLPLTRACLSSSLDSESALRSFRDHVSGASARTDGVLVPQYQSPFLLEYPRETPAFIRKPQ